MNNHQLGPLQMRVISIIWDHVPPEVFTVRQVHEALNAQQDQPLLAYTTILSIIRNLCRFGYLVKVGHIGHAHTFKAIVTRSSYIHRAVAVMADELFDGDYGLFAREVRALGVKS